MSRISPALSSPSTPGSQPFSFPCTPDCSLASHSLHRGKTGRDLSLGDIRTTTISLLAPFYEALKDYHSVNLESQSSARASTFRSHSGLSHSPSRRLSRASGSCTSGKGGPRIRPCIIVEKRAATAVVILMGTFEGAYIDKLHPLLQEYVAILFSQDSTYQEERFTKGKPMHMHSTPEWSQEAPHLGQLQYIVPLRHEVDLQGLTNRWEVRRALDGDSQHPAGDGGTEGYYMDGQNLTDLGNHAQKMYKRLRRLCERKAFRQELRKVLRERGKVGRNPNRSQSSFRTRHSCAPSVKLEPIPETPTTASHTRPTTPTPYKAENSWISTHKFSVSSTSSRSTASKRRSVYDDECPRTPKAAKQEFDTSSTHSRGSKRLFPFVKSSKANTSQPSLPSFASPNKYAILA